MDTGMLWFDDSDRSFGAKIKRAVTYYEQKYEKQPNLCVVHPSMLADGKESVNGVVIKEATAVMPHHYWIGVHQEDGTKEKGNGKTRKAA